MVETTVENKSSAALKSDLKHMSQITFLKLKQVFLQTEVVLLPINYPKPDFVPLMDYCPTLIAELGNN
jgi:hypothetical protein